MVVVVVVVFTYYYLLTLRRIVVVVVDWRKEGGGSVGVAGANRLLYRYDLIDRYLAAFFFNYTMSECTISNFLDFIQIHSAC